MNAGCQNMNVEAYLKMLRTRDILDVLGPMVGRDSGAMFYKQFMCNIHSTQI